MKKDDLMPKWQKEIENFKGIKSVFIIEGNIHDEYVLLDKDDVDVNTVRFKGIDYVLHSVFNSGRTGGYYDFIFCDPVFGFSNPLDDDNSRIKKILDMGDQLKQRREESFNILNCNDKRKNYNDNIFINSSEIVRELLTQKLPDENESKSILVVMNFASRFISSLEQMVMDDTIFFQNLFYATRYARRMKFINTLVLLVDKFNDIPAWFYVGNPNVRTVTIPTPERLVREIFIKSRFGDGDANDKEKSTIEKIVDLTDGMKLLEIDEIRRLNNSQGSSVDNITNAISIYKYGFKDDPWKKARNKIIGIEDALKIRVKGQEEAIKAISGTLKRAVTGLAGMQHSSGSQKPRGIFFLAGPTGTGKTEVVKALAERVFGDERSIVRFDMSEYCEKQSDQKLFGAPPGYVGYDNGGQLTNAVRNNPFSILLFDEIEKAHSSIQDKFLQILEDGRMTDGQGNTVYFSETLIFFTSNIGSGAFNLDDSYSEMRKKVLIEWEKVFKPEVRNRIGENNVIVFNYIKGEVSKQIIQAKIDEIHENVKNQLNIEIVASPDVLHYLYENSQLPEVRQYGGRGIGNIIEEKYITPLADYIFDKDLSGKTINSIIKNNNIIFEEVQKIVRSGWDYI